MSLPEYYMNLAYDLAGSISKNRFRNEMLWGLKKLFELYKDDIEFTMVFDYSCDIEVHKKDCFEFFQVKTQKNGTYTLEKLIKNNKGGSVLGKLYKLKFDSNGNEHSSTKIALVSNAPLSVGSKIHNNVEVIHFLDIDDVDAISDIKKKIRDELKLEKDINLVNSSFIRTGIDLINPEKTLIGETVLFFEEKFKSEPNKIMPLYRLLANEVSNKASYELKLPSYNEILEKKGINKAFLDEVLNQYIDNTDVSVEKVKNFIDNSYKTDFKAKVRLNRALTQTIIKLRSSKQLQKIEETLKDYISHHMDDLPDSEIEIVDSLFGIVEPLRTIEISEEEVRVLILLVMKKFEEGVYE